MDADTSEKAFKRVLVFVVVAEVLFGLGILYRMSPSVRNAVTALSASLAQNLALFALVASVVLVGVLLLVVRLSSRMPPALADFSRQAGIQFKRKRGNINKLITPSPLGLGLYFEGVYENTRVRYFHGESRLGAGSPYKLSILHPRLLDLSFLWGYPANALHEMRPLNELPEVASQRIELAPQGLEIWASDMEKALSLLKETDVSSGVRNLSRIVEGMAGYRPGKAGNCGFFMNETGLTVFLGNRSRPEKSLLDAMVRLSRAVATSPLLSSTAPRATDRPLRAATTGFLVLMVVGIAIIAWLRRVATH